MRLTCTLCGLLLVIGFVHSSPIVKREAEDDLSPLNEVYVFESEDDQGVNDERGDRDKRKIGIVKLGVTNGIINFVFGKLDAFLDAKTRALTVLDESNKVKNAAYGIDNTQSATGDFIGKLVAAKLQAASGSIGPVINSATTFFSGAKTGLANAFVSKLAPLSSLSGGLSSGLSNGAGSSGGNNNGGDSNGGSNIGANLISGILSSKINALSSLSGSSAGISAGNGGSNGGNGGSNGGNGGSGSSSDAGAQINLGAFANLGGGGISTTTEEDIPEFDRTKVSFDIPPPAFGTGFTVVTSVSKILSSLILNSARRTQSVLEVFKPFFRGAFAIKGLPSDNPK